MGATESTHGGNNSDSDNEEWMQADKYAEWVCADKLDYNGTAVSVRHVEMPLNKEQREAMTSGSGPSSLMTHEALVFEVMCLDGRITKFTAELTFSGVLKRWGHHKVISKVQGQKHINVPMSRVVELIQDKKPYNLISHNCKHYATEKFKQF